MRIRLTAERQWPPIQLDLLDAAAAIPDPIVHLDRPSKQRGLHAQSVERARHHRVPPHTLPLAAPAEKAAHDEAECYACSARVNAPAAVERNRAARHPLVLRAGLITIFECRVGAGVVAVRLAQSRTRYQRAEGDRICLAKCAEKALRLPQMRQRLRIAQMGVRVHKTDLAAEEGRALRSLEDALRSAVVGHRPIEQAHAIRRTQLAV